MIKKQWTSLTLTKHGTVADLTMFSFSTGSQDTFFGPGFTLPGAGSYDACVIGVTCPK